MVERAGETRVSSKTEVKEKRRTPAKRSTSAKCPTPAKRLTPAKRSTPGKCSNTAAEVEGSVVDVEQVEAANTTVTNLRSFNTRQYQLQMFEALYPIDLSPEPDFFEASRSYRVRSCL